MRETMKVLALLVALECSVISTHAESAQMPVYPDKPVRIVTSEPGGSNDFPSRLIAQGLSGPLGQNVIVDNRPSSLLGEFVARATPDGYTILAAGGTFMIGPLLQKAAY